MRSERREGTKIGLIAIQTNIETILLVLRSAFPDNAGFKQWLTTIGRICTKIALDSSVKWNYSGLYPEQQRQSYILR